MWYLSNLHSLINPVAVEILLDVWPPVTLYVFLDTLIYVVVDRFTSRHLKSVSCRAQNYRVNK